MYVITKQRSLKILRYLLFFLEVLLFWCYTNMFSLDVKWKTYNEKHGIKNVVI